MGRIPLLFQIPVSDFSRARNALRLGLKLARKFVHGDSRRPNQNQRSTSTWRVSTISPDISCSARKADSLERRLAVGFALAMTLKAD
jgi:hypothetical protein